MVRVEAVKLLLLNAGFDDEKEQVNGLVALQVRLTVPLNPLTEETLMVSAPLLAPPVRLMGTIVVLGTRVKSESGLAMGLVRVNSEGA